MSARMFVGLLVCHTTQALVATQSDLQFVVKRQPPSTTLACLLFVSVCVYLKQLACVCAAQTSKRLALVPANSLLLELFLSWRDGARSLLRPAKTLKCLGIGEYIDREACEEAPCRWRSRVKQAAAASERRPSVCATTTATITMGDFGDIDDFNDHAVQGKPIKAYKNGHFENPKGARVHSFACLFACVLAVSCLRMCKT